MKILLDTHILLWTLSNDVRLSQKARKLIENTDNTIHYSIISLWEVELKRLAHPNEMPISARELAGYCEQCDFLPVPIKKDHIFVLSDLKRLPDAPPHKDPFDRILICQASTENMIFVTHDSLLSCYEAPCILSV